MVKAKEICKTAKTLFEYIGNFQAQEAQAQDAVEYGNRVHDDIVHRIERNDCLYSERAKLATQLAASQRERRQYKDWLHTSRQMISWLESDKGKRLRGLLEEFAGVARSCAKKEEG